MEYINQLELQVKNNQQAVYDIAGLLQDYVTMRGNTSQLKTYMHKKYGLGSDAQIGTLKSKIYNFCKNNYLKLKKRLAFKK